MQTPEPKLLSRYLIELRRPDLGWSELEALTRRARAAAGELSQDGVAIRFLRAVFVPEDETCFLLFAGETRESVRRLMAHAGLAVDGFVETLSTSDPREVER